MVKPKDEAALAALPMTGGRLEVCFESNEDIQQQLTQFIGSQGLFVRTATQAKPFSEFDLVMRLPNGAACTPARARLVQVVPFGDQPGLMLQFLDLPEVVPRQLTTYLAAPAELGELAEPAKPPPLEEAPVSPEPKPPRAVPPLPKRPTEAEASENNADRLTIFERIRKLRPDERGRLAQRANKMERSVLLRDSEPMVLMFLIKNPNLSRQEAIEISRLKTINYQVVTQLLGNKQWAQIEELRYNLAVNPKTPLNIVLKLMPSLTMKHLREMAKNHGLKNQVKQAALRIVLKNAGA